METTPLSSTSALPPPPPIKQGLGVFVYDNGDFFFGEWDSNRIHGEGMLFFAFGGFVHGFFSSSRLTGPAFLKFADGEVYEGGWVDGKLSGDVYNYFVDESIWLKSHYTQGIFQGIVSEGQGRAPSRKFFHIFLPPISTFIRHSLLAFRQQCSVLKTPNPREPSRESSELH